MKYKKTSSNMVSIREGRIIIVIRGEEISSKTKETSSQLDIASPDSYIITESGKRKLGLNSHF